MAEYTLVDIDVKKELPNFQKGPALVYALTLREYGGKDQVAEMFAMKSSDPPKVGDKLQGEVVKSEYGLKFQKAGGRGGGGGGGFKRSPADTKAIHRQHSQEMALRREANAIAAGMRPWNDVQLLTAIDWFEDDIKGEGGKRGAMNDPLPVNTEGLP